MIRSDALVTSCAADRDRESPLVRHAEAVRDRDQVLRRPREPLPHEDRIHNDGDRGEHAVQHVRDPHADRAAQRCKRQRRKACAQKSVYDGQHMHDLHARHALIEIGEDDTDRRQRHAQRIDPEQPFRQEKDAAAGYPAIIPRSARPFSFSALAAEACPVCANTAEAARQSP